MGCLLSERRRDIRIMLTRFCLRGICVCALVAPAIADPPQSVAEKSDYRANSRYDDVVHLIAQLLETAPAARLVDMGKTVEGRVIPMIVLADPPVATPEQARKSGKLVAFAMGNIHAGEVCGKEALLMLAREIA